MSLLCRCVQPANGERVYISDFLAQLDKDLELKNLYEKFKKLIADDSVTKELVDILNAFFNLFIYEIDVVYEYWYNKKPELQRKTEALRVLKRLYMKKPRSIYLKT